MITVTKSASIAVRSAIELLPASATFQSRTAQYHAGPVSPEHAAKHVYSFDVWEPNQDVQALRPFGLVVLAGQNYGSLYDDGSKPVLTLRDGQIGLVISDVARRTDCYGAGAPDSRHDSYLDFLEFSFGVADELSAMFGGDNYPFHSIELLEAPDRPPPAKRPAEDFWIAIFALNYGLIR